MRRSFAATVAPVVILAMALTACGGGGAYKGLPKPTYIAFADAICRKSQQQRLLIAQQLASVKDQKALGADIRTRVLPLRKAETKELRTLKPPREDRKQVDGLWDLVDTSTDRVDKTLQTDPATALRNGYDPYHDATAFARAYGFQACGP